jgi:8-oxo-dGTP diphosphatase/2-hydroxy-dATP diphosphatase
MKKLLTLCMICKEGKILLGMKKRGFGAGRWNGFGGKIEGDETIEEAARREIYEESSIQAVGMEKVGILEFSFENDPKILEVHVFKIDEYTGEPKESEEMRPQWFDIGQIPYLEMWSDDEHWLPLLIAGKKFKGSFLFDRPSDAEYSAKILKQEIGEVSAL